jgi:hypothetical protein
MNWHWCVAALLLCAIAEASAQNPGEKARPLAGWMGVFPEMNGYQRTFTAPAVAPGKAPDKYAQKVKYEWTGGAIKLLEVTLARDPAFKDRHSPDALAKDPGKPERTKVGNFDAWEWKLAKEGDKGEWPPQARMVVRLGDDRALILEARGQGPWEPLSQLVKRFDLEKLAKALDAAPRTDFRRRLESFRDLKKGMSYAEAAAWVGEADEDIGSGIHIMVYRLDDGGRVLLGFPGFDRMVYARYQPKGGKDEDLAR